MKPNLSRQSFLGERSEGILARARVAVIGLGGGGSHVVQQLAHIGVGRFALFDPDRVEDHNMNRLVGATLSDVDACALKTTIAERLIRGVNPKAEILAISKQWEEAGAFLRDCDVVFGCVDSYSARSEIERTARRFLLPYIDLGMDVTNSAQDFTISGQVILSMPGGPCLWCLGFLNKALLGEEAARYGAAGGRPQVIWPNGILASAAVSILVQLVTPWHAAHDHVQYLEYDGNLQTLLPSKRLAYLEGKRCAHFPDPPDLGDPFWPPERCASPT